MKLDMSKIEPNWSAGLAVKTEAVFATATNQSALNVDVIFGLVICSLCFF
jgi:hypothetical protein